MNPVGYLETGVLQCEDNLHALAQFPAECIDLIYLDPPFFSNRSYEVIWGDEAEVRSFEDRWEGGIQHYVSWMRDRVTEMHRVLKPTGTIFLHSDWHASHYLKVMLDAIFGSQNFQNELIWFYRGGGSSPRRWSRKHDTIFFYSKGSEWTFNLDDVRTSYSEEILSRPKSSYAHHHYGRKTKAHAVTEGWDLNPKGKRPDDVIEMPIINPGARERLGYPTQKPEGLLEVFVRAASNPGDIVLDPFCGCGTTIAVAQRLNRQWIGIDISPTAVELTKRRVQKSSLTAIDPKVIGVPVTEGDLRSLKPFEFQNWVIQRINGTHSPRKTGDMGIDGYSFFEHLPIQVKQSERVGRNVVDNFETALRRAGYDRGYIVAFSFGRGAYEEVARAKSMHGLDIALVSAADLIFVGDLIESANLSQLTGLLARERRQVSKTPDLMRLFSGADRPAADRPLPSARGRDARPSFEELIKSDTAGGVSHAES